MMTREQFIEQYNTIYASKGLSVRTQGSAYTLTPSDVCFVSIEGGAAGIEVGNSQRWLPAPKCGWFVKTQLNLDVVSDISGEHGQWVAQHCKGKVVKYRTDYDRKLCWWGFTNPDDILLWTLRWGS